MSRDENQELAPPAASRKRGRPRVWANTTERRQAHTQRRSERERLLGDLLHAVRNARWEEAPLQRTINAGDDCAVLRALTEYYRQRHWMRPVPAPRDEAPDSSAE